MQPEIMVAHLKTISLICASAFSIGGGMDPDEAQ